jgi:hypothetical protein
MNTCSSPSAAMWYKRSDGGQGGSAWTIPERVTATWNFCFNYINELAYYWLSKTVAKFFANTLVTAEEGWDETNPTNILKHPYTDIRNNYHQHSTMRREMDVRTKIRILVRLFSTHWRNLPWQAFERTITFATKTGSFTYFCPTHIKRSTL